jgi:hypothetical protein
MAMGARSSLVVQFMQRLSMFERRHPALAYLRRRPVHDKSDRAMALWSGEDPLKDPVLSIQMHATTIERRMNGGPLGPF